MTTVCLQFRVVTSPSQSAINSDSGASAKSTPGSKHKGSRAPTTQLVFDILTPSHLRTSQLMSMNVISAISYGTGWSPLDAPMNSPLVAGLSVCSPVSFLGHGDSVVGGLHLPRHYQLKVVYHIRYILYLLVSSVGFEIRLRTWEVLQRVRQSPHMAM